MAFSREASKIVHEWHGHLEFFSRPLVIVNPRQYLLLRTAILQKAVVGCPLHSYRLYLSQKELAQTNQR